KSTPNTDIIKGRFVELVPGQRMVLSIDFVSDDLAFSGAMMMTWCLVAVKDGAKVTIVAENVPAGIGHEEHEAGMASSLANLATFVE
ncbi:MAG TPA: SRPBCC domain-containing protein, partial [Rhodanobacter sp.]|nr:SRPBCC domain-containing protein [Rhodanobacter sp.]